MQPLQKLLKQQQKFTVSIRKGIRDAIINQKRQANIDYKLPPVDDLQSDDQQKNKKQTVQFFPPEQAYKRRTYCMRDFDKLVEYIRSNQPTKIIEGLHGMRKLLSNAYNNSIAKAAQSNLYRDFIKLSAQKQDLQIKQEALNCLINSTAGEAAGVSSIVAENGGVQMAMQLLKDNSKGNKIYDALWLLTNMALDDPKIRDFLIDQGILQYIQAYYKETEKNKQKKKTLIWAISNLCRGDPSPDCDKTQVALPFLCNLLNILTFDPSDKLSQVIWSISYFCEYPNSSIILCISSQNVIPRLIQFLRCPAIGIVVPTLRSFTRLYNAAIDLQLPQTVLALLFHHTTIKTMFELLDLDKKAVRKEIGVVLASLLIAHNQTAKQMISNRKLLQSLFCKMESDLIEIRKELYFVAYNLVYTLNASAEVIRIFDEFQVMKIFVNAIKELGEKQKNNSNLHDLLRVVVELFRLGQKKKDEYGINPFKLSFDNNNGKQALDDICYLDGEVMVLLENIEEFYETETDL